MAVGQRIQGSDRSEADTGLILNSDCGVGVGINHQPDRFAGELVGHLEEAPLIRDGAILRTRRWIRCWKIVSSFAASSPNRRIWGRSCW